MKRIVSILLVLLMLGSLPAISVSATGYNDNGTVISESAVSYIESTWDDVTKQIISEVKYVSDYTVITSETRNLTSGWYVVQGDVTLADTDWFLHEGLKINGEVHLVLADGVNFTVEDGVSINNNGSLYIYAQSQDADVMGSLTAGFYVGEGFHDLDYPAIGGVGADIIINGGAIDSRGFIGGEIDEMASSYYYANSITVNGGIVNADIEACDYIEINGGTVNGDVSGQNIVINGGTADAPYIGTTNTESEAYVTINGGNVTSAYINCCELYSDTAVTINGGIVSLCGSGDSLIAASFLTINGGTVVAENTNTALSNPGIISDGATVIVNGGNFKVNSGLESDPAFSNSNGQSVFLNTITLEGVENQVPVCAVAGVGDYVINDVYTLDNGKLYFYLPANASLTSVTTDKAEYVRPYDGGSVFVIKDESTDPAETTLATEPEKDTVIITFIDKTSDGWLVNSAHEREILLIDNDTNTEYVMTSYDGYKSWQVEVPEIVTNITFKRVRISDNAIRNQWDAGQRNGEVQYCVIDDAGGGTTVGAGYWGALESEPTEPTNATQPTEPTIPPYVANAGLHMEGDMTNWQKSSFTSGEYSIYLKAGTYNFRIYDGEYIFGSNVEIGGTIEQLVFKYGDDMTTMVATVDGIYKFKYFFDSGTIRFDITYPENAPEATEYVDFFYTVDTDKGEVAITEYIGTAKDVIVPQYIEGYPVTTIGINAFRGTFVEKITLPEGLKTIESSAFSSCVKLTEVVIPETVTDIQSSAFFYCPRLQKVNIPSGITVIKSGTFQYVYDLEDVVIPEGVVELEHSAFDYSYIKTITLPKSLETIGYSCFSSGSDIVDVYYNGSESDWEKINVGDYNRRLLNATIHFAEEETLPLIPEEEPSFSGASLTLQDNISINFKVSASLFDEIGYKNPYVVYEMNGLKYSVVDYTIVNDRYAFDFKDISPANMNDTLKATLHADYNGVHYTSETREYSVATYCYNMLGRYTTSAYAELQTLLVDLLNYGAMSQIYTGHNTDALVNANLTDAQKAWGTSEKPVYESVQDLAYKTIDNPTVQWKGGGLNLVDAVTMRFKISADSYENLVVQAETDDRIWTIPYEEFSETTDGYYVYFSGLNAGEMSEPVYLTVYEGSTAVSNTLCYSIESYAYSKQNSTDTNLVNLLEAMMKYGNSAYAYVN